MDKAANEATISMLIGYNEQQELNTRLLDTADPVNATDVLATPTATAALLISTFLTLITIFAMVMMSNIQTPKSFARRDLVKGKINK